MNVRISVELLQYTLRLFIIYFRHLKGGSDQINQACIVLAGSIAMIVLMIAVVLDLFTRILYFGEPESRGTAFEEVPERG